MKLNATRRLFQSLLILCCSVSLMAAGTINDSYWDGSFGATSAEPISIRTSAQSGSTLYVGGTFPRFLGMTVRSVMMYDGNRWRTMDGGVTTSGGNVGTVSAIAIAPNGDVFIGGVFAAAGGVPCKNIARWDGNRFHPVGAGVDGSVNALDFRSDALYIGGRFDVPVQGGSTSNIAKWNGSSYEPLGSGISSGTVTCLISNADALYVGGNFKEINGEAYLGVTEWLKSSKRWVHLGNGLSAKGNGTSNVFSLGFLPNGNVVALGDFAQSGTTPMSNMAVWNMKSWAEFGGGVNGVITASLFDGNDVYVSGVFDKIGGRNISIIARWNGTGWSASGGDVLESSATALVKFKNGVLVSGTFDFTNAENERINGIGLLEGTSWMTVTKGMKGNGADGGVFDFATMPDGSLIAAGGFSKIGDADAPILARYDGTAWTALEGVPFSNMFNSIRLLPDGNNLLIGCVFTQDTNRYSAVMRYNPTSKQSSPLCTIERRAQGPNDMAQVACLLRNDGKLYMGGNFRSVNNDTTLSSLAVYDGTAWKGFGTSVLFKGEFQGTPFVTQGSVNAVAFSGADIYAGGFFNMAGAVKAISLAKWTGTEWKALGTENDTLWLTPPSGGMGNNFPYIGALALSGDMLYAGGNFSGIGAKQYQNIAAWNTKTQTWSSVGNANGQINVFHLVGDYLYVGGGFDTIGGIRASRIARYHIPSNTWYALGSGVDGNGVFAMHPAFNGMYVGGIFGAAGEKSSLNLAKWTQNLTSVEESLGEVSQTLRSSPNPVSGRVTVQLPEGAAASNEATVVDMQGRIRMTSTSATGETQISFDTHTLESGIYTIRILANGKLHAARISVVH